MTAHLHPVAYAPARHRHQRRLTRRSLWLFVRRHWRAVLNGIAGGAYLATLFAVVLLAALWRHGVWP